MTQPTATIDDATGEGQMDNQNNDLASVRLADEEQTEHLVIEDDQTDKAGEDPQAGSVGHPEPQAGNARPRNHKMKFQYATGARPLDGYTIKRGIGVGGFGEVYYAISDAGKDVALKLVQRNLDIELRGVSHCLNLKHPNLLALFDIKYDEAGNGWVVMEYIQGESLREVLRRNPNGLPHDQVNTWLTGIAAGVACLHEAGVVHRDLKPGNLFDDGGIVKIGDYGLSKFITVSRRSAQTESVGTCHYMAPEIGKGRYGREIDVYAVGIILYEMLTGRVPFDGETTGEIMMKHLTDLPNLAGLPEPYRSAIQGALEKDPDKRLNSVAELMAALGMSLPGSVATAQVSLAASQTPVAEIVEEPLHNTAADYGATQPLLINDDGDMSFGPVEQVDMPIPAAISPKPATPEEPIAQAVKTWWTKTTGWFTNPSVNTPLKVALLVGGVLVALFNAQWLVPLAIMVAIVYGVYYAIRAIVLNDSLDSDGKAADDGTQIRIDAADSQHRPGKVKKWRDRARLSLAQRPLNVRASELIGSMLMSTIVMAIVSVVIMIAAGGQFGGPMVSWGPQYFWLVLTGAVSAWAVLLPGKAWEADDRGDQVLRRFLMLAVGLLLGSFAYGIDRMLLVHMDYGEMLRSRWVPDTFHLAGVPQMAAYLAFFGGLFVILRWWRQTDPLRTSRFSLWSTICCGLWGFILPFPQPWGFLLAAGVSIAVQLAAPWVNAKERARLKRQFQLDVYRV